MEVALEPVGENAGGLRVASNVGMRKPRPTISQARKNIRVMLKLGLGLLCTLRPIGC